MGLTAQQLLPQSHEEMVLTIQQPLPRLHPEIWKKEQAIFLALVVRRSDNTIHWINLYPVDNAIRFAIT